MANEQNLIPLNKRGKEEAKKIRQKGQAAQKAKQREAKTLKEYANFLLNLEVDDQRKWNKLAKSGVPPENCDNKMLMVFAIMQAAQKGDIQAAKEMRSIIGEDKPAVEAVERESETQDELIDAIKRAVEVDEDS